MAEEFQRGGLRLVAGGTDTHLMLVDVSVKGLTGKAVEAYLDEIGITVNKNAIPFDKQKPFVASGIRIGTPAITSRGFGSRRVPRGRPHHLRRFRRRRSAREARIASRARSRADLALRRTVGVLAKTAQACALAGTNTSCRSRIRSARVRHVRARRSGACSRASIAS